jgi:branched-chain amino acid aminotransferase
MRKNVLAIAQDIGMEILETPVGINALDQAEEVFLSNAIKGVQWVKGFKQKRYFHKISETMISELNKAVLGQ